MQTNTLINTHKVPAGLACPGQKISRDSSTSHSALIHFSEHLSFISLLFLTPLFYPLTILFLLVFYLKDSSTF